MPDTGRWKWPSHQDERGGELEELMDDDGNCSHVFDCTRAEKGGCVMAASMTEGCPEPLPPPPAFNVQLCAESQCAVAHTQVRSTHASPSGSVVMTCPDVLTSSISRQEKNALCESITHVVNHVHATKDRKRIVHSEHVKLLIEASLRYHFRKADKRDRKNCFRV